MGSRVSGLRVESGYLALFDHIESGGVMWTGSGTRSVLRSVRFGSPFGADPAVQLSLAAIDAAHEQNLRLTLSAIGITSEGFTIECHTWDDTRIGRLAVNWMAIGPGQEESTVADWDV